MAPEAESSLHRNGKVFTPARPRRQRRWLRGCRHRGADGRGRRRSGAGGRTAAHPRHPRFRVAGPALRGPRPRFLRPRPGGPGLLRRMRGGPARGHGRGPRPGLRHNIRSTAGNEGGRRIRGGQQVQAPAHLVPRRLHADQRPATPARPRRAARRQRHPAVRPGRERGPGRPGGRSTGPWRRAAGSRSSTSGATSTRSRWRASRSPVRRPDRRTRGAGGLRDPLPRPDRRELLRQARAPARLVVVSGDDPERGAAHQAVGLRRRARALGRGAGRREPRRGPGACTFSFHNAFRDPATPPGARDRQSIEVRCVLLYG